MPNKSKTELKVTLRPARGKDVHILCEMVRELGAHQRIDKEAVTPSPDRLLAVLLLQLTRPWLFWYVIDVNGKYAGYAVVVRHYSTMRTKTVAHLEDLYLREQFRGQGIGRKALAEIAKNFLESDYDRLYFHVEDWNVGAKEFYRSCGAKRLDTWELFFLDEGAMKQLARFR